MAYSKSYRSWRAMRDRCNNPNNTGSKYYADLNIQHDPRWEDFSAFYTDMGDCPEDMELDRKNNNEGYTKSNCRWATHRDNLRNSSTTKLSVEKVRLIKGLLRAIKPGTSARYAHRIIGEQFGVGYKAVWGIETGRNWSDVV